MLDSSRKVLYLGATIFLAILALACIWRGDPQSLAAVLAVLVALWIKPPGAPAAAFALIVLLPACTTHTDWHPFGFRSSSIEMTPQASNPTPSGVGGLYTKTADGIPRLVSTSSVEYPAGEARHIFTYAGAPPGAVIDDCWMDSTDANRLWCLEDVGAIRQRFDGIAPGPLGCGGTPAAGCFTTLDTSSTVTFSGSVALAGYPYGFLAHADTAAATVYLGGADRVAAAAGQVVLLVVPAAGTIRALTCSSGTAPGGIVSDVYTVSKSSDKGASWALSTSTCTITGTAKTCADVTHFPTVAQYDWLAVQISKDGLSVSAAYNCQVNVQ